MYAEKQSAGAARAAVMVDAAHVAVAVLAVSLGYCLRTVVPYVNARAKTPGLPFEARYALWGLVLWLVSLWTALETLDALPDLFRASLGATFLAYLGMAVAANHVVFEALDKARAPSPAISQGG
jgi:hypothetical protein